MTEGLLKPGALLNNTYEIVEMVGDGGTGEVYRATNTASQRTVAIKILKAQFSQDPKFIDLMRRELLHNVSDDAVVRYYDLLRTVDDQGGHYFLVMDFIEGPSLADLMDTKPMDAGFLMTLAEQVTKGLAACHRAKIFHRDISPDNIILRDGDPAKATLIDFGIAKDVNPDAKTVVGGGFAGKYEYAAPEQLDGLADARSDIYSFGMTLLAASQGRAPQLGTSFLEIVKAKHSPVDTTGVNEPLRSLIDAMVQPAADDRPQSASELQRMIGGGAPAGPGRASAAVAPAPVKGGIESLLEPEPGEPGSTERYEAGKRTDRRRSSDTPKKKGKGGLVFALVALALGGAAAFFTIGPGKDMIPGMSLPEATPYELTIDMADGAASVKGYAPSESAVAALSSALAERLEIEKDAIDLTAASGAPNDAWQTTVTALAELLMKLEKGRLSLFDDEISLQGVAPTPEVEAEVSENAGRIARAAGYRISLGFTLAPQPLPFETVDKIVDVYADCGPLESRYGANGVYAPGDTIGLEGAISSKENLDALKTRLSSVADDRTIDLSKVQVINPSVCRVRDLLPPTPDSQIKLLYYSDITELEIVGDAFNPDDFAVIEMRAPKDLEGYLYVFIVDNEFNAIHLRPAQTRPEHLLSKIGTIQGKERVVPITWPQSEGSREKPAIGFSEPYGEALVFALVSDEKMFPFVRADVEDTREFAPELAQAVATRLAEGGKIEQAQRFILVDAD